MFPLSDSWRALEPGPGRDSFVRDPGLWRPDLREEEPGEKSEIILPAAGSPLPEERP